MQTPYTYTHQLSVRIHAAAITSRFREACMMLFNLHVLTADPRGHVRIRDAMQGIQIEHEVNRGQRGLTSEYLHNGLEFLVFSEEQF